MDMIVGHFGQLEFLTGSELRLPFAREAANLANATVREMRGSLSKPTNNVPGVSQAPEVIDIEPELVPSHDVRALRTPRLSRYA